MNDYLVLISRADFNNLYKYGHMFVHYAVPFNGDIDTISEDKALFNAVTRYMDTFEYFMEYLVLHFKRKPFVDNSIELFIRDIEGVFTIDENAKRTLETSIDSRIKLQVSSWSKFFEEKMKEQLVRQALAGKYNCYEIFDISKDDRCEADKLITPQFVMEIYEEVFKGIRPSGDKSLLHYLIRYERHALYWNDIRGFLSDAIHIYENYRKKEEIAGEIADETEAFKYILESKNNDLIKVLKGFEENYGTQYLLNGCRYLLVATIYLLFSNNFKEGGINPPVFLENKKYYVELYKKFGFDFALAIALLGITLGQDLTYSCYYQIKGLRIFQDPKKKEKDFGFFNPKNGEPIEKGEIQNVLDRFNNIVNELLEENKCLQDKLDALNKKEDSCTNEPKLDSEESTDSDSKNSIQDKFELSLEVTDHESEQHKCEDAKQSLLLSTTKESDIDNYRLEDEEFEQKTITRTPVGVVCEKEYVYKAITESQPKDASSEDYFEPVLMKEHKKTNNYRDPKKNGKEVYVHTREEHDLYYSKGYRIYIPKEKNHC